LGKITECVSVTRKEADITPELLEKSKEIVQYHIYDAVGFDGVTVNCALRRRRTVFRALFNTFNCTSIRLVEFITCYDEVAALAFA